MSELFNAAKPTRNAAFHFDNDVNLDAEVNGDQGSRWSSVPANLGTGQKLAPVNQEPAPENPTLERGTGRYGAITPGGEPVSNTNNYYRR